jgi:chromate transporter
VNRVWGAILLAVWVAVLVVCIVLVSALKPAPLLLRWWEAFYRIGSIIYGGGQVGKECCSRVSVVACV